MHHYALGVTAMQDKGKSKQWYWLSLVMALSLTVHVSDSQAELIKIAYNNLILTADLERAAASGSDPDNRQAPMVLLVHGGLAHRDMELMRHLRTLLHEHEFNTLAINLSLGISERRGMFDCNQIHRHQHHDAIAEINVWFNWLTKLGYQNIILLGHSRGAGQAAWFVHEKRPGNLRALVLMAAQTRENGGAGYERRYKTPLAPTLQKAQQLIQSGKGRQLLPKVNILFCREVTASAASFVSYYGPDRRLDTPGLLSQLKLPTLLLVAEQDQLVPDLKQRARALPPLPHLSIKVIEGSGHFFRDLNAEDAIDAMTEFIDHIPH